MPTPQPLTAKDELGSLSSVARRIFRVMLDDQTAEDADLNDVDADVKSRFRIEVERREALGPAMLADVPDQTLLDSFNRASNLEQVLSVLSLTDRRGVAGMLPDDERVVVTELATKHGLPVLAEVFTLRKR